MICLYNEMRRWKAQRVRQRTTMQNSSGYVTGFIVSLPCSESKNEAELSLQCTSRAGCIAPYQRKVRKFTE